MAFTQPELDNILNMALDFHVKQGVQSNTIQNKPLLAAMTRARKTFPGGKELITKRVKGDYATGFAGYDTDDTVTYQNPAETRQAEAKWYEHHSGIVITHSELKIDGISVDDSSNGRRTTTHSQVERTRLASLLEDKLEDMDESHARGLNSTMWLDGVQDAKASPGVQSIVVDNPAAAGDVLGIDPVTNTWWRNRALTPTSGNPGDESIVANLANASDQVLVQTMQREMRQLRRYGGRPNLWLAGSDFLDQLENELRAKGQYTDSGWANRGGIDVSVSDPTFQGMTCQYDPSLDDLSLPKTAYILDTRNLCPYIMDQEWWRPHSPPRPAAQYLMYRAYTSTFGMMCTQRNCQGVYYIA